MPVDTDPGLVAASAITLGASVAVLLLALVRAKLLAIALGTGGVAVIANVATFGAFALLAATSLTGQGVTRAIAESRATGEHQQTRWLIRYTLTVTFGISLLVAILTILTAPQLSAFITGTSDYAGLVTIAALTLPLVALSAASQQVLQAFLRVGRIAKGSIVAGVATLAATLLLAIPFGLPGAVIAVGIGAVLRILYFHRQERPILMSWRTRVGRRWNLPLRPIIAMSLSGAVLGLSSAAVMLLVRSAIVAELGLDANGTYQPAVDISETYFEVVLTSTSLYLFAKLTKLLAVDRYADARQAIGHGLRLLLVVTVPIILITIGFGSLVIRVLYSEAFVAGESALAIQMAGSIFKVVAWSVGAALLPLGMHRWWLTIGLVFLGVRFVGTIVLAPLAGLDGVAMAYVGAWGCAAVVTLIIVARLGGLPLIRGEWVFLGTAAVLVALAFATARLDSTIGAVVALLTSAIWVTVCRRDLSELIGAIAARGGIRWPWQAGR